MLPTSVVWVAVAAAQLAGAPQPKAPHDPADTLAVPYIAQPPHLCGGAAMAMVERFWGRRGVYASDFAHLVREEVDGIVTSDLHDTARDRGWNPRLVYGPDAVRALLETGVPIIALIEVASGRNHYVVLLSWSDETVVYHDPAIAPSQSVPAERFVAQWTVTDRWAMAVLPSEPTRSGTTSAPDSGRESRFTTPTRPNGRCYETIQRAHQQLEAGDLQTAASLLQSVLAPCGDTTWVRRALAGVRFRQKQWNAAARLAADYVGLYPEDPHAWSLLGASRFLTGNEDGALEAWNAIGEPRIDLLSIEGLRKTRFRAVAEAIGLEEGDTLEAENLEHARRRLNAVPSVLASRIRYRPVGSGLAEIRAQLLEREWSGGSLWAIGETVTGSLVHQEIDVDLISVTGGGERLHAGWRWPSPRRRFTLGLDAPAPFGVLGTLHLRGQLARETFISAPAGETVVEERRTAELAFADWLSSRLYVRVGGGVDRWERVGDYGVARIGIMLRPISERLAFSANTALWASPSGAPGFTRLGIRADWRSNAAPSRTLLTARVGLEHASSKTPLMEWPSAGISTERSVLLRAHRLIRDDIVTGSTMGRTLVHGGVTADRWLARLGFVRVGAGMFTDVAAVWHSHRSQESPYRVDAGAGIRIGSGFGSSVLRVDVAQALIDSGRAVSVSLSVPWPG